MADIATIWDTTNSRGDWALSPPILHLVVDQTGASVADQAHRALLDGPNAFTAGQGLLAEHDLRTAVAISLFTDRVADPDDVIPDGTQDPRGWWGDLGANRPIGSKLWLRLRAKQTDALLLIVKNDVEEALAWLIEDQVAAQIDVSTEWTRPGMLGVQIIVARQSGATVAMKFDWAWKDI